MLIHIRRWRIISRNGWDIGPAGYHGPVDSLSRFFPLARIAQEVPRMTRRPGIVHPGHIPPTGPVWGAWDGLAYCRQCWLPIDPDPAEDTESWQGWLHMDPVAHADGYCSSCDKPLFPTPAKEV